MTKEKEKPEKRNTKERKSKKVKFLIPVLLCITICLCGLIYIAFIKDRIHAEPAAIDVSETIAPVEIAIPEFHNASILSAGDIILHSPFLSSKVYRSSNGSYDFTSMFRYIKQDYQDADFTVVNLETTISDSNYCGYPTFRSPAAIVDAIAQSQADLCLLANNHIYDNYDKGVTLTMNYVEKYSLLYTGTRKSASDSTYLIQEINGIKVGIFNYVYETGSADEQVSINAIPVSSTSAELINTFHYNNLDAFYETLKNDLAEMKEAGAEYTIAYLHWGNEYQTKESNAQRAIAKELCELGIDALIGGHPHVIQPVDLLTNEAGDHQMVCVYSMGNHVSNQRQELMDSMPSGHTEDGLMVKLVLQKLDDGPVSLIDAEFIPTWVYKTLANGGAEYYILPLDDTESLLQETSEYNITSDVENSLKRTNAIIGEGVEKIQNALPIKTSN